MNFGKRIRLVYDQPVFNVSQKELSKWALKNIYENYMHPISISYGNTTNEIYLDFLDFNSIAEPCSLECFGCVAMGSDNLPFNQSSTPICLKNLWPMPSDNEYLGISDISFSGELQVTFNGKVYEDEYLALSVAFSGSNSVISAFNTRYISEYVALSVTMSGQYCDVNGNPL